jgi:hypothetical protein
MGKDRHKDKTETTSETYAMLKTVDPRIADMTKRIAGDRLGAVVEFAEDLILLKGKTTERALADALEKYKLV